MYQMAKGDGRLGLVVGRDEIEVARLAEAGLLARLKGIMLTAPIDGDEVGFVLPAPWNGGLYRARHTARREGLDLATATRYRKGPLEIANFEIRADARTFRLEAADRHGHAFALLEHDTPCGGVTPREFTPAAGWYADIDVPDALPLPTVAFIAFLVAEGRRRLSQAHGR